MDFKEEEEEGVMMGADPEGLRTRRKTGSAEEMKVTGNENWFHCVNASISSTLAPRNLQREAATLQHHCIKYRSFDAE